MSTHRGARPSTGAAVVATFALGTAIGDVAAITLNLGYLPSMVLFAAVLLVPAIGFRWFRWNPILSFWVAYVITRPVGASLADWMGKPTTASGLGWGSGRVSAVLAVLITAGVAYLAVTRRDLQQHVTGALARDGVSASRRRAT